MDTVVIGAGAAGLAAGSELRRRGRDFVVLDAGARPGDPWRGRYDSLRLFTPARFCALPGLPMPLAPGDHPDKDAMADYLTAYARHAELPVRPGVTVRDHTFAAGRHVLTGDDTEIVARRVVVATGSCRVPATPGFATGLDPAIRQLHSADYRRPADLPPGPALVVGAGPAGADIALELARDRPVWLAGPVTGHVPVAIVRSELVRRLVYRRRVPSGRLGALVHRRFRRHGSPLIWQSEAVLRAAGVRRVPRVTGVTGGLPVADGRPLPVAAVVWCTGFRPGHEWLDARALDPSGLPVHERGVSRTLPGLGFVGLPLQNTFGSGFLGGMSGDAEHVVGQLT